MGIWLFCPRGTDPESDTDILVDFDHKNAQIGLMEYVQISDGLKI